MRSDTTLLAFRPELNLDNSQTNEIEHFQNVTLRPILKAQHELWVLLFQQYIQHRKRIFLGLSFPQRLQYINDNIKSDVKFKNRLIGAIIGLMTLEETSFFYANEAELSRRSIEMLIQRLQSVVTTFVQP